MADDTPNPQDDLSGPSPGLQQGKPDVYLVEAQKMHKEKRWMRISVFAVAIFFACLFLYKGLMFAYTVGTGIVNNQAKMIDVMLITAKTVEMRHKTVVSGSGSTVVSGSKATEVSKTKPVVTIDSPLATTEHFNWLSTGSLLVLVGFLLAVGLTLILTLVSSAFRSKNDDSSSDSAFTDLTTPVSRLFEEFCAFLKSKISS